MGVQIAIDDFGTGFSSLSYLQQFPIDSIKIDREFIKGIPFNKNSISITGAIVALAHSLDIKVVAEGVETSEQFEAIKELNCEFAQGYFIKAPLTADEFVSFYREQQASVDSSTEEV